MAHRGLDRRQLLKCALGTAGVLALSGCDNLSRMHWFRELLGHTEALTERVQRAFTPVNALAREYQETDISAVFPANGNIDPGTEHYAGMVANNFAEWRVPVT